MPQQSLRFLPVSLSAHRWDCLGTGLACRVGRDLIGWPAWLAEAWIGLGLVVLASLLVGYTLKVVRHRDAVRAEFAATGQAMFAGAAPIALTLAAAGLAPYAPAIGRVVWYVGAAALIAWQVIALARVLRGGIAITDIHPGWFLTFIGGIVVPLGAVAHGMGPAADVSFAVSVAATPMVMGIVLWRLIVGPPLPDGMKPVTFILIVPPAVIFLNYGSMAAAPAGYGVDMLYYAAWLIALALAWNARGAHRWPFTPRGGPSPSRSPGSRARRCVTSRAIPARTTSRSRTSHSPSRTSSSRRCSCGPCAPLPPGAIWSRRPRNRRSRRPRARSTLRATARAGAR